MKQSRILSTAIAVMCVATGLRAENKKITFFSQAEYLTYSGAFEKSEDAFNKDVSGDRTDNLGMAEVTSNNKTAAGAGFRIGVFAPSPLKNIRVGGSFGYIMGPSFTGKENVHYNSGVNDAVKVEDTSHILRYMGETRVNYPLGEKFQARLSFALGFAALKVSEKVSLSESGGGAEPYSSTDKHSINTIKLSWEIGPAIAYVTDQVGVELALTYAQMPSAQDMNTFQEFKWNPIGVRLGVEF